MNENDCYKILEVSSASSLEDIKKSYKKLALKYHPDLNSGEDEHFKLIHKAYEYLSKNYRSQKKDNKNGMFSEMFSEMFKSSHKIKSKQLLKIDISLEEAMRGLEKNLNIFLDIPCHCNIITRRECKLCLGLGFIKKEKRDFFIFPKEIYQNQIFLYKDFYENIDLQIRINILPNDVFKVRGKNIESEEELSIFKSILGGNFTIRTPRGLKEVDLQPYKIHNFNYVLKGMGIQGGDHIVRFKLTIPEDLTEKNKEYLREIINETQNKSNKVRP